MNYLIRFARRLPLFCLIVFSGLLALTSLRAQSAGTGTITGRVLNPATKEYVQNAEVHLQNTNFSTVTTADGSYTFFNVPAGDAAVAVDYTGYQSQTKTVTVAAGQTAALDFNIISNLSKTQAEAANDTVKLQAFTVESEREGNAKAIMQQKASMNMSRIVASETFGNIAEGNIGEFLKYLPSITMDYVEADARNPRIRGLPAQYTTVTFNGLRIASADAFIQANGTNNGGGAGKGDRSFGFDVVSMSSIGAVEVDYTINASQDADGAAGNIDMIPKHAYERSEGALTFEASAMMNSEEMRMAKIVRPDNKPERLILPNLQVQYTNSFFDHRLGIVAAFNESNSFNEQRQFVPTYDATPTATDPRPLVITKLQFKDGPKFSERSTGSLSFDFKVNDHLSLSLLSTFNGYDAYVGNRTFAIATASRANVGGDGVTAWNNVPISAVTQTMQGLNKRTFGYTHMPTFQYKWDNFDIDGALGFSKSTNNYSGNQSASLPGNSTAGVTISPTGMTATASRPADDNYAWTIQQTGGLDWGNVANYKAAATGYPTFSIDGRYVTNIIDEGRLDIKYTTPWKTPTWFKVGGKTIETTFDFHNPTQTWNYIGPGGGLGGSWANFPSALKFNPAHGASITSISGSSFAVTDQNLIGATFKSNPGYFVDATTPATYLTSFVTNPRYIREEIDSLYAMFDTKPIRHLEIQAGLRGERTRDELKNITGLSSAQVIAAGFPVTAGSATTIPGINFQYLSHPRELSSTGRSDLYPSASIKYEIKKDLVALFGYSYTVTRPSFNDIAGTTTIDDTALTIKLPNSALQPAFSNNYSLGLTKYFEPVGSAGISVFQNDFKNFTQSVTAPAAQAADALAAQGLNDPIYAGYTVTTTQNLPGLVTYRGYSMDFTQSLSFLPEKFKGFSAFANYTRLYYTIEMPNPAVNLHAAAPYNFGWLPGITPNIVNYGLGYQRGRFSGNVKARWTDKTGTTTNYNTFMKQNTKLDVDASIRLTDHFSLYFYARNLLDVRDYVYANNDPQRIGAGNSIEYYGAYYYAGIKGSF